MPRTLRKRRPASPGRAQTPPCGGSERSPEEWARFDGTGRVGEKRRAACRGEGKGNSAGVEEPGRSGHDRQARLAPGEWWGRLGGRAPGPGRSSDCVRELGFYSRSVCVCVAGGEGRNLRRETEAEVVVATTWTKRRGRREEQGAAKGGQGNGERQAAAGDRAEDSGGAGK